MTPGVYFHKSAAIWLFVSTLCPVLCIAQAEAPTRTVYIPVEFERDNSRDRWDRGFWIMFKRSYDPGREPQVWSYDRDGKLVIPKTDIRFPDARYAILRSVAATGDGGVVASAELWNAAGEVATVLCSIAPGGRITRVVRTDSFFGDDLAVAPNGHIWAFGTPPLLYKEKTAEYDTLAHYDRDGKLLGRHLPRAGFGVPYSPTLTHNLGISRVVASPTRVGVFSARAQQWIEFSSSGELLDRFTLPPPAGPDGKAAETPEVVMTESGAVYGYFLVSPKPGGKFYSGLHQLDRANRKWVLVPRERFMEGFGGLFGFEGNSVILRRGCCTYGWFPAPDVLATLEL